MSFLKNSIPWSTLFSTLFLLSLWQGCAVYIHNHTLPPPLRVAEVLWFELQSGQLLHHLGITLRRLGFSFSISMLLGATLGILFGRYEKLNAFFDQWLVIFLNIPALVTIILCYVWFGLEESAAILAVVINKLPNVIITFREGARALNQELLEMARCYRFSRWKTLYHVILPQLHPFIMSAIRSGLALVWKIILVVELLGRSDGMGYQLQLFFQLFDVASILAYTVAFVTVIQLIEFSVLKPLDRHAQRWRK
jgi:NitT/TauT family transport system permease protein